jgi:adenylate cyclase
LIEKYAGTVGNFSGDGILVFFNDPYPVDQPALQAVRMAIEMRDQILELVASWEKREHALGFGIGIDQGYASIGPVGFDGRWDYAIIGYNVNRASRLCAAAQHGQILISQKVFSDVEAEVEVKSLRELDLKGCGVTMAYDVGFKEKNNSDTD